MSDRPLPIPGPVSRPEDCLAGGGEMGALMRSVDWSETPFGPVAAWPQSLRTTISIMLESRFAMVVAWGADFRFFYNDRYRPVLGATKHPSALGKPGAEIFPEVWPVIGPEFERVRRGQALAVDDWFLPLDRNGYLENCWFTLSYSPIRDETGGVGGLLAVVAETTDRVEGERRLATLRELARRAADAKSPEEACRGAAAVLEDNPIDVPFAILYLLEADGRTARRVCAVGLAPGPLSRPETVELAAETDWPLARAAASGEVQVLTDLGRRFGALPGGPYPEPTHTAVVLPLSRPGLQHPYGLLVAGISPRRAIDDRYRGFLDLAADHIATAISNARAFEAERQRAEALAEIDRAKTAFFSNVSHEFRTPLTLILGPIEDALAAATPALAGDALGAVHRNALRLLRLVNALLDFSRIEAGRLQAAFAPTDLAALTAETAGGFRAVIERTGLTLTVRTPALSEPAFVDHDMWEKILLNLLSNAFKFTFEGGVTVTLREAGAGFELEVADTGTGIPEPELPHVFERFHRVVGARSRSHEGSGIGLALVRELARMHGGDVRVESAMGRGSTFTVTIPRGSAHLASDLVGGVKALAPSGAAAAFVEEARRWIGDETLPVPGAEAMSARILVADDNADMRAYLMRILGAYWSVQAVADGAAAVAAAFARPPDLVMTDVMMPGLDGFEVLRMLRADDRTAHVPVVMLSARAGEEASVEGLGAGADDYLVKPFSARELVARVRVHLARVQAQRVAEAASRAKDEFLAMLGHELRNPLSPILTALQIIRLRGGDPSVSEHAIIERQVQHMVRLVDDLLDVSRITGGKVELKRRPVELAAVVAKAVETVSPLLEKRAHRLTVAVPAEGLRVNGDEFRLSQVVANLVGNAAKYTPEGGQIAVTGVAEDGEVVLSVRDSGIGIDVELLPRIFDAFTQGKRSRDRSEGGLGLGLAIARSLVVLHGGTIRVASGGPGQGAELTVRLPALVGEAAEPAATPTAAVSHAPAAARRILIVDDNLDGAELMREVLRIAGHETRYALDGPSAMRLAADFRPEVAFLDIGLPVMDGYELAQRLRDSMGIGLKLVAVTGYGQEADKRRSREAGFIAHVVKPVDFGQLRILLDDLFVPPPVTPRPPSP